MKKDQALRLISYTNIIFRFYCHALPSLNWPCFFLWLRPRWNKWYKWNVVSYITPITPYIILYLYNYIS